MGSDDLFKKAKALREFRRTIGIRGSGRERILIVCEGEKTECIYFNCFRLTNVTVNGSGKNTDSLVRYAIEHKMDAIRRKEKFDQVWCVFDRDSFPPGNFNEALFLAQSENIKVAYSNEAFELWYLLHFNYYDSAFSRHDYEDMLTELLGHKYEKNSSDMYEELLDRQTVAIRNASRLLSQYNPINPERDNPSTTVHLLLDQLNKYL